MNQYEKVEHTLHFFWTESQSVTDKKRNETANYSLEQGGL